MLHILKSPRCYKVRYILLVILRTTKFKLVPLSHLQGESQVYVFHLLVGVGFLPCYEHRFLKLQYLQSPGSILYLDFVNSESYVCYNSNLNRGPQVY